MMVECPVSECGWDYNMELSYMEHGMRSSIKILISMHILRSHQKIPDTERYRIVDRYIYDVVDKEIDA